MSAEITCPHCNWLLVVEPGEAARDITCWNCGRAFVTLAAAGADPLSVEEPAAVPPTTARPTRSRVPWAVATVAVIAVGVSSGLAWVNARRAAAAERDAGLARAERDAAEEKAEAAVQERDAARRDAEAARQEAAKAVAALAADQSGLVPGDIPDDVREAALAQLRKVGEAAAPLFRKAIADNRAELARLKGSGRSPAGGWAAIRVCEQRIMAAERALRAWEQNDLSFFAPNLPTPADRGAVGRIAGGQVRVARVLGPDAAVVEYPVGPPGKVRPTKAVVTGVDSGSMSVGRTADLADVLVVAGSVTLGRDTYPRLAVFTATPP